MEFPPIQSEASQLTSHEGVMLELSTHTNWARMIKERFQLYGSNDL